MRHRKSSTAKLLEYWNSFQRWQTIFGYSMKVTYLLCNNNVTVLKWTCSGVYLVMILVFAVFEDSTTYHLIFYSFVGWILPIIFISISGKFSFYDESVSYDVLRKTRNHKTSDNKTDNEMKIIKLINFIEMHRRTQFVGAATDWIHSYF